MLMASHVYLALRSLKRPATQTDLSEYLSGAIAPDVRYLQTGLRREITHSLDLGAVLAGPFGLGYRHHLRVDQGFYGRCETHPLLRRLGPMNMTILAELHALRALGPVPGLTVNVVSEAIVNAGVSADDLREFVAMSNRYLQSRDIDLAIQLLTGPMRERAARYLAKWERWGPTLKLLAGVSSPLLSVFFDSICARADELLREGVST